MEVKEALETLIDIASRWGENFEWRCVRRIEPDETDEACAKVAEDSGWDPEDVIEVRDLWRAIVVVNQFIKEGKV